MRSLSNDPGSPLKGWMRALEMTASLTRNTLMTLPAVIERLADQHSDALALLSDEERLTYRGLSERSNRYARWALREGLARGDVVSLLMSNSPEYMSIWLGITRIGAVVSLLNTNLVGDSLAHCINVVAPKHVIVEAQFYDRIVAVLPRLAPAARCWVHGRRR